MMIAALNFVACSSDDEDNGNGDSASSTFTITIDGNAHEYGQDYLSGSFFGEYVYSSTNNYLKITTPSGDFQMTFPASTNPSSFFSVGYANFEKDATKATIGMSKPKCTYVSGTAKVTKNDGSSFTVNFTNFKYTWNDSREIIFHGTLNFPISNY